MSRRQVFWLTPLAAVTAMVALLGAGSWGPEMSATALELPGRLSNQEFWRLSTEFSEPNGFFQSDNLVSNEDSFQFVIPELKGIVQPGGVYLGVGPDQNFTYIAALEPRIVFITDVRRGNLLSHLLYKALFEISADRAEFLSRLFSRARPDGLDSESTASELFAAYATGRPDPELRAGTWEAIEAHLIETRELALTDSDLAGMDAILRAFFALGPSLTYSSRSRRQYPTYRDLQTATDLDGASHSYLSSAERYQFIRSLQERNLIVPVVGNFAGDTALRAVGAWVREHGATVTTFYTSNVEQYLFQDRIWDRFAENVASLPLDESSTFIRSCFNSCVSPFNTRSVTLLDSMTGLMADHAAGRIGSYWAVLNRTR